MGLSHYLPARIASLGKLAKGKRRKPRRADSGRRLRMEPIEPRVMLAAAGLIPVGEPIQGALTGKIVYTSGGHGWQWNNSLNRYATDRPEYGPEIVEDFGNQDQMTYYAEYLLRAGATVVPMRPVGHQTNEVVLDNDSPGVTFSGAWSNSISSIYYDEDYGVAGGGNADSVPYRFASINAAETATATYTPNIPEAGFYPVYTWVRSGTDRTDQLYKITDSSGTTKEIRVDHRMVGRGWVYLGTYHFDAGSSGNVQISNRSTSGGSVVIADAVRFGNGMGDSTVSGGPAPSGYAREDENSWHWISRSIGIGTTLASAIGSGVNNVSAPSNFAQFMNTNSNPFGTSVYVSFHSNGSTGDPATATARGVLSLIDSDQGTPNQAALALYTASQINDDMLALNGTFEHNWFNRSTHTLSGGFGEIDLGSGAEMDATIVEVGFHDNTQDSQLLRDPRVRDQIARSTYEGTLQYFDIFGGLNAPVATASAPVNLRAMSPGSGQVTLHWNAGPVGVPGAAATGFRIYASTNGYAFDGGTLVAGGGATTATLSGYDPTTSYFFKVVAVNAGGESHGSEVMAVTPAGGAKQVLIVNGFDRLERSQNFRQPYAFPGDGRVDRVRPRYNNSFDYVSQVALAIQSHAPGTAIDSTSNQLVESGAVNLANYSAVVWILGEESTIDETFSSAEQAKVSAYLAGGGKLLFSGSEIGWDLDRPSGPSAADRSFFNSVLKAAYVADDAGTYTVNATAGSIFAGLPQINFDNGTKYYDTDFPDRISPTGGATTAMTYSTGGAAAIQYADLGTGSKIVMLAFPFETITTASARSQVMGRVLDFFAITEVPDEIERVLDNDDGVGVYNETGSWTTATAPGYNGLTYRFATVGDAATAQWTFFAPFAGRAELAVQYAAAFNRADDAVFSIDTGAGVEAVSINQKVDNLVWVPLGEFYFQEGVRTITLDASVSSGGSVVIADVVRVRLFNVPEPTGDFDDDGDVDGADFLTWQRNLGAASPEIADGDANSDGDVDGDDLSVWQQQFGSQSVAVASGTLLVAAQPASLDPGALLVAEADLAGVAQRWAAGPPALTRAARPAQFQPIAERSRTDRPAKPASLADDAFARLRADDLAATRRDGVASFPEGAADFDGVFSDFRFRSWRSLAN